MVLSANLVFIKSLKLPSIATYNLQPVTLVGRNIYYGFSSK